MIALHCIAMATLLCDDRIALWWPHCYVIIALHCNGHIVMCRSLTLQWLHCNVMTALHCDDHIVMCWPHCFVMISCIVMSHRNDHFVMWRLLCNTMATLQCVDHIALWWAGWRASRSNSKTWHGSVPTARYVVNCHHHIATYRSSHGRTRPSHCNDCNDHIVMITFSCDGQIGAWWPRCIVMTTLYCDGRIRDWFKLVRSLQRWPYCNVMPALHCNHRIALQWSHCNVMIALQHTVAWWPHCNSHIIMWWSLATTLIVHSRVCRNSP